MKCLKRELYLTETFVEVKMVRLKSEANINSNLT